MCNRNFEKESIEVTGADKDLFTDKYENHFIYLDKFERYCQLLKTQNVIKKREKHFIHELEDDLKQEGESFEASGKSSEIKIENIQLLNNADFLKSFLDNKKHLCDKIDDECNRVYQHRLTVECRSVFEFKRHVFARLSALLQQMLSQRYDWSSVIIGRDLDNNCFKIRFFEDTLFESIIRFEIKSTELNQLKSSKESVLKVIEQLFSYYPGLYYNIVVA
jgi:hypothetical protein